MGSRPRTKELVELGSGIRKKKPKRQARVGKVEEEKICKSRVRVEGDGVAK